MCTTFPFFATKIGQFPTSAIFGTHLPDRHIWCWPDLPNFALRTLSRIPKSIQLVNNWIVSNRVVNVQRIDICVISQIICNFKGENKRVNNTIAVRLSVFRHRWSAVRLHARYEIIPRTSRRRHYITLTILMSLSLSFAYYKVLVVDRYACECYYLIRHLIHSFWIGTLFLQSTHARHVTRNKLFLKAS